MDPNQQQGKEQEQQSRQGPISQGINSINNLRSANRIFQSTTSKIGSRIAFQAGSRAVLLIATPWFWGVVGIAILVIFVFVIVFSGFSGGIPGAPTTEPTPTIAPTETITPTPAVP